jgi:hypothetical protein
MPSTPSVEFASASESVVEGNTYVSIPVDLSNATSVSVTVQVAVSGGSAVPGTDFNLMTTSLGWNLLHAKNQAGFLALARPFRPAGGTIT